MQKVTVSSSKKTRERKAMLIKTLSRHELEIDGNIKNIEDFNKIKECISSMHLQRGDSLKLFIRNSFSMPSAIIGYMLKLIQQDNIKLHMYIDDDRLIELLDDLNLKTVFNVHATDRIKKQEASYS